MSRKLTPRDNARIDKELNKQDEAKWGKFYERSHSHCIDCGDSHTMNFYNIRCSPCHQEAWHKVREELGL